MQQSTACMGEALFLPVEKDEIRLQSKSGRCPEVSSHSTILWVFRTPEIAEHFKGIVHGEEQD